MRAKIIFPNLLAVLTLGLGGYFYLNYDFQVKAEQQMRERIKSAQLLFQRSEILRGYELLHEAGVQARSAVIVEAFAPIDIQPDEQGAQEHIEKLIRQRWFETCATALGESAELWLKETGKKPELAFLTDRNGMAIARNIVPHACPAGRNTGKSMSFVTRALGGEANCAIWSIDDSPFGAARPDPSYCQLTNSGLLELAAVPVWYGDKIAGVLVAGFEISSGVVEEKSKMIDFDLAFVKAGNIYSASLATDAARKGLDKQLDRPEIAAKIDAVLQNHMPSETFDMQLGDELFVAVVTPVVGADEKDKLVNIVMGSVTKSSEHLESMKPLVAFIAGAILIVLVAGAILANHFLKPVMAIEEGLLRIINGEYDYRLDVRSKELGGLGYRINQLVGVLMNEEEKEDPK